MSKNKSYNSILFLTTLSVYLGLVLVGSPSSVAAQQVILTSKFDVQKEIEAENDLDRKPEDEGVNHYFLTRFDNALNDFIRDLRELKRRGRYKFSSQEDTIVGGGHTFCSENVVDATSSYVASWVSVELERLRKNLDVADGKNYSEVAGFIENPIDVRGTEQCKEFNLDLFLDKTEFKVNISFTQNSTQKAVNTAADLNTGFSNKAVQSNKFLTKGFYRNTRAKAENQYVSVITRLPRGSLDALVRSKR